MTYDEKVGWAVATVFGILVASLVFPWEQPGKWLSDASGFLRRRWARRSK